MLDEKVFSKKLAKLLSKFGITDEELRNSFIEDLKKEIEEGKEQPKVEEDKEIEKVEIEKEPTEENKEQEKEPEIEKTEDKEEEEPKVEKETETETEKDKVDVKEETEGEPKVETEEEIETKVEEGSKTEQETKDQVQETLIGFGKRLDALEDLISKIADAKQESFGVDAKNNGMQSQTMSFQDRINRMRKGY